MTLYAYETNTPSPISVNMLRLLFRTESTART